MRSALTALAALAAVVLGAQSCRAGLMLTLTSTPTDLSHLSVGQTVSFKVTLSGLNTVGGEMLDELGATVEIKPNSSKTLFSVPAIAAGPIVPPGGGFFTAPSQGIADATYDDLFNPFSTPITGNGVFFSFSTTALAAGTGRWTFTFTGGFESATPVTVAAGPDVPFTILAPQQAAAVPEPASSLLWAGVGLGGGIGLLRRFRRWPSRSTTRARTARHDVAFGRGPSL